VVDDRLGLVWLHPLRLVDQLELLPFLLRERPELLALDPQLVLVQLALGAASARPAARGVRVPVAGTGGRGYSLLGHHEILIPLIAAGLVDSEWAGQAGA
jgi:hypothetical protein